MMPGVDPWSRSHVALPVDQGKATARGRLVISALLLALGAGLIACDTRVPPDPTGTDLVARPAEAPSSGSADAVLPGAAPPDATPSDAAPPDAAAPDVAGPPA